jgi:hypothetical protein
VVALALVVGGAAQAQPIEEEKTVRIQRTARPPVIDGELDEEIWARAPLIDAFHQVTPVEFNAPSERTEVYLLYDRDALYIGVRMFDAAPNLINARVLRQGQAIGSDDQFFVHIDPYNNRRGGYLFGVNPNGVRYDGIFEGVTQRQFDWDGIWQAAARVTADGWIVEMAIPFKTLSFDPTTSTWRMNFARNIERKNEGMAWISRNRITDLSTMGNVTGISQIEQGRGLDVVPSMSVRERRAIGAAPGESAVEPSVDVFYKITPQLNASLTVNTDFSATEVDDRQVNLTRFSLFFPERRDFFLQDVDIFQFGRLQQDGRPFFSRRLGIGATGQPVPLDVGAKVSGRIGRFDVGTLAVQQEAYTNPFVPGETIEATTAFVGRVAANVLDESSVGMIVTRGDPGSNLDNSVAGVDFRYLNSRLLRGRALQGDAWFQKSDSPHLTGNDTAFGVGVNMPSNTGLRGAVGYSRIDENFNPALGFVRRTGRRVRPPVHEHRPVEGAHELDVIHGDVAGQRVQLLQDPGAAESPPLMRRRVGTALVLGRSPERLGARVGAQAPGLVEGDPEIVAERRLAELPDRSGVLVVDELPLAREIRGVLRTWRLGQGRDPNGQHRPERDQRDGPPQPRRLSRRRCRTRGRRCE